MMPDEVLSSLLKTIAATHNNMALARQIHLCPSRAGRVSVCTPRSRTFSLAEPGQWLLTASATGELREATSLPLEPKGFKDTGLDCEWGLPATFGLVRSRQSTRG